MKYRSLLISILCCIFIYQSIELTIKYRRYLTIARKDLEIFNGKETPALTICRKKVEGFLEWRLMKKEKLRLYNNKIIRFTFKYLDKNSDRKIGSRFWSINLFYGSYIGKLYLIKKFDFYLLTKTPYDDKDFYLHLTDPIIHNSNDSRYQCLTFFSKYHLNISNPNYEHLMNNNAVTNKTRLMSAKIYDSHMNGNAHRNVHDLFRFLVHSPLSPPQVYMDLNKSISARINSGIVYYSRGKREYLLESPYDTNCFNYSKNVKTNKYKSQEECKLKECTIQNQVEEPEKMIEHNRRCKGYCKEDCLKDYTRLDIIEDAYIEKDLGITVLHIFRIDLEEVIYHLPMITFNEYLCTIGGIFSMWFGVSVYSLGNQILHKTFKSLRRKLVTIFQYFKFSLVFICLYFATIGIRSSIKRYRSYEYQVRIEHDVQLRFPSFIIESNFVRNPQSFTNVSKINLFKLRKTLYEKHFNNSCWIIFRDQAFDCEEDKTEKSLSNLLLLTQPIDKTYFLFVKNQFYYNLLEKNKSLIKLSNNEKPFILIKNEVLEKTPGRNLVSIQFTDNIDIPIRIELILGKQYFIKFIQTSINTLEYPFATDCIPYGSMDGKYKYYANMRDDLDCIRWCVSTTSNSTLKCVPIGFLLFEYSNLEYCPHFNLFDIVQRDYMILIQNCRIKCRQPCSQHLYELGIAKVSNMKANDSSMNYSLVKIMPTEFPIIKYVYSPRMDLNELVINVGGVIGLWFGCSLYSILYFIINNFNIKPVKS